MSVSHVCLFFLVLRLISNRLKRLKVTPNLFNFLHASCLCLFGVYMSCGVHYYAQSKPHLEISYVKLAKAFKVVFLDLSDVIVLEINEHGVLRDLLRNSNEGCSEKTQMSDFL